MLFIGGSMDGQHRAMFGGAQYFVPKWEEPLTYCADLRFLPPPAQEHPVDVFVSRQIHAGGATMEVMAEESLHPLEILRLLSECYRPPPTTTDHHFTVNREKTE